MGKYYVVVVKPFSNKCFVLEADSHDEAIIIAKNRKDKYKEDVIIARKNDEDDNFIIEKYGYYKVYNFFNKIILVIAIMLIFLISYLYYKYKYFSK
jgi:hypothetical protein